MNSNQCLGLNFLINFHKLCGISYLGYSIKRQSSTTKILSIFWNFLVILNIVCHIYFAEVYTRIRKAKSYLPMGPIGLKVLSSISTTNYLFIGYLHLLLLFKSRNLLSLMQTNDKLRVSDQNEVKIGRRVALFHGLYITSAAIIYLIFHFLKNQMTFNWYLIITLLKTLFLRSSESAIVSLIAYKSFLIENRLNSLAPQLLIQRIDVYHHLLIEVRSQMKKLDKALSSGFLVIIIVCIQNQIINCVFLCIDFKNSYFHIVPHSAANIVLYNIIPNSMTRFYDSIVCKIVAQYPNQRYPTEELSNLILLQIVSSLHKWKKNASR